MPAEGAHASGFPRMARPVVTRPRGLLALVSANGAIWLLIFAVAAFYLVCPLLIYAFAVDDDLYLRLAGLAAVSVLCILLGSRVSLLDGQLKSWRSKFTIGSGTYVSFFFLFFLLFVVVTISTAPSVPLLSALSGADVGTLSVERGSFLKGRDGVWAALGYVSSVLTSTLIPYCIVVAYATRSRLRHAFLVLFFAYSVVFVVKVLFLNLVLPLIAYGVETGRIRRRQMLVLMTLSLVLLGGMISVSGYGSLDGSGFDDLAGYLTASYVPGSTLDFLVYRSMAIPIFSVIDTLHVHQLELGGELLLGSTSSLLAAIGGVERVNIERMVFAYQYGAWNDLANSNVVFIADGYINFGLPGVAAYGLIVGLSFRIMRLSPDIGVRSLAPLYAFLLYSSPLIGMLLSNGFALFFLQALFLRRREEDSAPAAVLRPLRHVISRTPPTARHA